MQPHIAGFLGAGDAPQLSRATHFPGVTQLPTHLSVASGSIENDGNFVLQLDHFQDLGTDFQCVISEEPGRRLGLNLREFNDLLFLGGSSTSSLHIH